MRIHFNTSPNNKLVPFHYQANLVGAIHKWLGINEVHDSISLYSLSWLSRGRVKGDGLDFPRGSSFFISAPNIEMVQTLISGVQRSPEIAFGMRVEDITLQVTPQFGSSHRFFSQSPILVKRTVNDEIHFYFPPDPHADEYLTETLRHKLREAGKPDLEVQVHFDKSYNRIKTKVATYKGFQNKATICPVVVEGDPEAVAFAWEVGAGNLTGIGFGALIE